MPVSGRLLTPLERKIAFTGAGDALRLRTESALPAPVKRKRYYLSYSENIPLCFKDPNGYGLRYRN
jgi:hypothetical protein